MRQHVRKSEKQEEATILGDWMRLVLGAAETTQPRNINITG